MAHNLAIGSKQRFVIERCVTGEEKTERHEPQTRKPNQKVHEDSDAAECGLREGKHESKTGRHAKIRLRD